ncbi:MAG: hypothetical protein ACR2H7_04625 [Actinomycetota bacterium]
MASFLQTPPVLPNAWTSDRVLREGLAYHLGADLFDLAEPALTGLGRVITEPDVLALGV